MINSNDAASDKQYLDKCEISLDQANAQLAKLAKDLPGNWGGTAAAQCLTLLAGFQKQISDLMIKKTAAVNMLDTIVNTYRDADAATANRIWGR